MRTEHLLAEARECRRWAPELAGLPDQHLVLKLADTFEQLARAHKLSAPAPDDLAKK